MRFFLYTNPQTPGPESDTRIIETVVEQALRADRAGFAGIVLTEHHFDNYNTYANSFMLASYLAPQLTQAALILAITVPANQSPVELAERANLLDQLAKGRAIIGVGPGGSPVEFAGLGRDYETRHEAMDEALAVAEQAWALEQDTEPLTYATAYSHGRINGRIMPSPYGGKPKPQLARATLSDDGFRWAGSRGLPVFTGRYGAAELGQKLELYRSALTQHGHSEKTVADALRWTFVQKMVYVADTEEQARADLAEPIEFYQSLMSRSFPTTGSGAVGEGVAREALGAGAGDPTEFLNAAAIWGSPDMVIKQIEELAPTGLHNLGCWMYFGDMPVEKANRSMDLFIDEVMPHFGDN